MDKLSKGIILLVEDNESLNDSNSRALCLHGYQVMTALTLGEARERLGECEPDIILLDVMLPDGDGFDFCAEIERRTRAHIIFLTARMELEDRLRGLSLGGDDYIVKPFHPEELLARIDAAMRRREKARPAQTITRGTLTLGTILVPTPEGRREIPPAEICYVEVRNHTCTLYTQKERVQTRLSIGDMAALLPPPQFQRCHRSFIVNLAHVRTVDRDFVMMNGDRVYIRGKDIKRMEELFAKYLAAEAGRDWEEGTADSHPRGIPE